MGREIWLVRAAHNAALPLGPSGALSRVAGVALSWELRARPFGTLRSLRSLRVGSALPVMGHAP